MRARGGPAAGGVLGASAGVLGAVSTKLVSGAALLFPVETGDASLLGRGGVVLRGGLSQATA